MVKAAATTAAAHAPPTQGSHGKTQDTVAEMARAMGHRLAANAAHTARAHQETINPVSHVMKCSARTHAAPALTWVKTSATLSTNVSQPAMYQRASRHLACPHAAVAEAAEAAIVVVVVETSAAAGHDPAAVAGAILAAGFGAKRFVG